MIKFVTSLSFLLKNSSEQPENTNTNWFHHSSFFPWKRNPPPAYCAFIEKDVWYEKKTTGAIGLKPLGETGIYYKDILIGKGLTAKKGRYVKFRVFYKSAYGSVKSLEYWLRLECILGNEYLNIPAGVMTVLHGMQPGGRRTAVIPLALLNNKFSFPVFTEIDCVNVKEKQIYSERREKVFGKSIFETIFITLGLEELMHQLLHRFFGIRFPNDNKFKLIQKHQMKPAETATDFFEEDVKDEGNNNTTTHFK